ncbi:MAG: hypothetical protein ACNA8H_03290 [Anaerolineales bacterium]
MSPRDRALLLVASLLTAYQITFGIDDMCVISISAYTIAFGILLVASLLLIILGFEVLNSPFVVILATILPLSLSFGLVWQFLPAWYGLYLGFAGSGLLAVVMTRAISKLRNFSTIVLVAVHGIAGLVITILPLVLVIQGSMPAGFALVSLGGALIGVVGLLLSFLKLGKPLLSRQQILSVLPGLLLLMTAAYVAGFAFA